MNDEQNKFIEETFFETAEDKDRFQILHDLSGLITIDGKQRMYYVVFPYKHGNYKPAVLLDDGTFLPVNKRENDLLQEIKNYENEKDKTKVNEPLYYNSKKKKISIPTEEKYQYFLYEEIRYKFSFPVFWMDKHQIKSIDNVGIHSMMEKVVATKDIYDDIYNTLYDYYNHESLFEYDVMCSFIVESYLVDIIGKTFYLTLLGKKSSGKSTLLLLLSYLCKNGFFTGRGTVPSSVRLIAFHGITLCQDEFEKMDDIERIKFTAVMNNGFTKVGRYTFVNPNKIDVKDQIESLKTYCAKAFTCNALDGFDESLISRCYIILSTKTDFSTQNIDQLTESDLNKFQKIRNDLFVYCMTNWKQILDDINEMRKQLEDEKIFARERDTMSIILGIIKHFKDEECANIIKKCIIEKTPIFESEKNTITMEVIILDALVEQYEIWRKPFIDVLNFDLHHWLTIELGYSINSDEFDKSYKLPRKILSSLGLLSKEENQSFNKHGQRVYHINVDDLKRVLQQKNYIDLIDRVEKVSSATSATSAPSKKTKSFPLQKQKKKSVT